METNPTRVCELLVGLPDVVVLGVDDTAGEPLGVHVAARSVRPACPGCEGVVWRKDSDLVQLVDLPAFGRPTRLMLRKQRWECPAGRWVTEQVGKLGRTVAEVSRELGCDWHTVNDAVIAYGTALIDDDPGRIGAVWALGLDETLFNRQGRWRTQQWCTSIVNLAEGGAQLLDVVAGRSAAGPCDWLDARAAQWRSQIRYGVMDLSGPYRKVFDESLGHVTQVADPFHLVKLANTRLDECRRRVQNETLGHRGTKNDPLYRARRLLTKAHERLDDRGNHKLAGLLRAGDPRGEVRTAWHAKEVVRSIYQIPDPALAAEYVTQLAADLQDDSCPPEIRSLGRTIVRWRDQIVAWHRARVSNGPTEAIIL